MKKLVLVMAVLGWVLYGSFATSAATVEELYEEQLQASGGTELFTALPEETQTLLRELGIDTLKPAAFSNLDVDTVWDKLLEVVRVAFQAPLATAGTVLAVVLLYAWMNGWRHTLREEESTTVFGTVCVLSICGCIILPLIACLDAVREAMSAVGVFMTGFTPVYAGVLLSNGQAATALSFQSLVFAVAQLLSLVSGQVIVPLLTISLAIVVTGSVTPQVHLDSVGKFIGKAAVWLLTGGTMLFSGLLSLQNVTARATDTLGTRAVKFSISSFVPVVGNSLSEAFSTIRGCLQTLHSTLGAFGMAATVLILLPPLLQCIGWDLLLSVCGVATDLFELSALTGVIKAAKHTVRCMIGVLTASGAFLIIAVAVVLAAGG